MLPDGGDVTGVEGKIEEGSEIGEGFGTKVFKVEIGKVIGAKGRGVFRGFDGFSGLGGGEGGERGIKGEFMDLTVDLTGEGILFMGDGGGVLLV